MKTGILSGRRALAALLLAAIASSQAPALAAVSPSEARRIRQGDVVVKLKSAHPIYHLDVYGAVEAPPEEVWTAITTYDRYQDFLPLVTESAVRQRRSTLVHQFIRMSPPWPFNPQWMVNACVEDRAHWTLSWTKAEGTPRHEEGYWQLTPLAPSRTQLHYHLTVDPWLDTVPSWVIDLATRSVMPAVVHGVRKRVRIQQASRS